MGWPITHPSTIYAIRCKHSGRVYIGRTYRLKERIQEHFTELRRRQKVRYNYGSKETNLSRFQKDYDKYGEEDFEVYILEEDVMPEHCKLREAYWIAQYNATNPLYGYNRYDEHAKPIVPEFKRELPPNRSHHRAKKKEE